MAHRTRLGSVARDTLVTRATRSKKGRRVAFDTTLYDTLPQTNVPGTLALAGAVITANKERVASRG